MVEELDNFFLISFFVFNALFIDFSDSKQTHLRRINWNLTIRIKEPSSSVHLPSSTTGCLFLLAHCHYKALQGDVSHRGRPRVSWHSPEFRHPDTQSHAEKTHIYSLSTVYVKVWSTQTGTHQRSEVRQWRKHPQQRTFYWGRCIIQLPGQRGREGVWFMVSDLVQIHCGMNRWIVSHDWGVTMECGSVRDALHTSSCFQVLTTNKTSNSVY